MKKPNFFVVGAAKAGTTSLYNYLKEHPEVYLSPIKEPNYFNTEMKLEDFKEDIQKSIYFEFDKYFRKNKLEEKHFALIDKKKDYLELFREVKQEKAIGEFSTSYLSSQVAAAEIYKFNPKSKIIVMLREPIERTLSHYQMDLNKGFNLKNILKDLENDYNSVNKGYCISNMYIDLSLYYDSIKRIFKIYPKEQVLIIRFENFKKHTNAVVKEVCTFLEIDNNTLEINSMNKIHNKTLVPRTRVIQYLLKVKRKFPNSMLGHVKWLKKFFFKKPDRNEISGEVKMYIEGIIGDDYKKTNILIKDYYAS